MVLSPNVAIERQLRFAVAEAVVRDAQGHLQLRQTRQLQTLQEENAALWFVAATPDGASVSHGVVPAPYAALAPLAHLFHSADIRGAKGISEIASVEHVETGVGEVRVLFGGAAGHGWPALAIFKDAYPIYGSLFIFALPAIFLAVPRIVRHALLKVRDVAKKASEIEPRRHGVRLPVDQIPSEVAPLVVAFNGTLERLETEFHKRRRFLIDAAHELRTPIAIMQTRIDGMSDGPERSRLLGDVARLGETAEQLLDFERHDQAVDMDETVDLVDLARSVVADLAALALGSGYLISFESDVTSLQRKGNAPSLDRAIRNLIRNAIDHGNGKGMIEVVVSSSGEVTVADEGPGIALEHQELVFEPFYRVVPKSRGAGLGLSLVKQIAENHGGKVGIESGPSGTRVSIQLYDGTSARPCNSVATVGSECPVIVMTGGQRATCQAIRTHIIDFPTSRFSSVRLGRRSWDLLPY
ncbi:HAMP domain-containing sensor histidine kinase [Rhizobium sp. BK377]|uniref:sensor histidine kinase n=1 Tax=Rhizobium sp. BK377 TaxID=2587058 RepID=UPI00180F873D|nr:HAMP domain-containing sensor histidine kinase [Rhizobium sp. BK377]MBB3463096.1 signal transduction histidine kinase [Rhizobium sp. BK377]